MYKILDLILGEAFQRIGTKSFSLKSMPGNRSLSMVYNGTYIAEAARVSKFVKNKEIIKVEESICYLNVHTYTIERGIKIKKWPDLIEYNVATLRGAKILEAKFKNMKMKHPVQFFTTPKQLFFALSSKNRDVEVVLSSDAVFDSIIKSNNDKNIYKSTDPLLRLKLYTLFNKKFKDLASKLSDTLLLMKNDGSYKRILARVGSPLSRCL